MGVVEEPGLLQRHRVSVDEYYRMAEAGVLPPDARVELIDGEVIDMPPMNSRHYSAVLRLNRLLTRAASERATVACQLPLGLSSRSEPEPDLLLLAPREDDYFGAKPTSKDVLLLIEVSDSTARYDRRIKVPLYARHGVTEVWIVDLDEGVLRFFRQPSEDRYLEITTVDAPGLTPVAALPGLMVDLSGLLQ